MRLIFQRLEPANRAASIQTFIFTEVRARAREPERLTCLIKILNIISWRITNELCPLMKGKARNVWIILTGLKHFFNLNFHYLLVRLRATQLKKFFIFK